MLKTMLTNNKLKEKGRSYYLRNYVIRPFFQVLMMMQPKTLKFELIQLNYEIVNNLKNRDYEVREKAREALKIIIDTLGIFVCNVFFYELKAQLHSGYQRYIMTYTNNYMIGLIERYYNCNTQDDGLVENKDESIKIMNNLTDIEMTDSNNKESDVGLVFDYNIAMILPILLEEVFGDVAEEKEVEQLVRKTREARETKAYNSFAVISSKVEFKNGIINMIYPLRAYLMKKENDIGAINKANEIINHIVRGLKNNNTINYEDILLISYAMINLGIDISLKNSKEVNANKLVTIKGRDLSSASENYSTLR